MLNIWSGLIAIACVWHSTCWSYTFKNSVPCQPHCINIAKNSLTCGKSRLYLSPSSSNQQMRGLWPPNRNEDSTKAAVLLVYFVQGILGLSRLATTFYLKDSLNLDPATQASLIGITSIPWLIKPLYGFLSDTFPLLGSRRRSYLALSGIVGALSWLSLGTLAYDTNTVILALTMGSLSVAVSDVVVDSIVVETINRTPDQSLIANNIIEEEGMVGQTAQSPATKTGVAGDFQSLCWGASSVGSIAAAYLSGSLLQTRSPQQVFLITSFFPLLVLCSAFGVVENQTPHTAQTLQERINTIRLQLQNIVDFVKSSRILSPILFIFLWQATPSPDTAMLYFYTNELGFGPEFLGQVRFVSSIAALIGVTLYRSVLKDLPLRRVFLYSSLLAFPLSLSPVLLTTHVNRQLGVPDELFTLTDSAVLSVLGQVSFMPVLALAASICPPGAEGTIFATLMSIFNSAGTVSSELGALLMHQLGITAHDFEKLPILVATCAVVGLLPLLFLDKLLSPMESAAVAERDKFS